MTKLLVPLVMAAAGVRREDVHSLLQVPIVSLGVGTRLYSCQQHQLDPQRDLWTILEFEYFGYCMTVESAAEKMAKMGWPGEPEDIGKFDPSASYAKVWQVVRPCKMVLADGKNSSTLTARFGQGASFQHAETLDLPNWRSEVKSSELRSELLKSDGVVQCDSGIDVAVFHGIATNDPHACIRQVEPDRLPTAAELRQQQQAYSSHTCDRFT